MEYPLIVRQQRGRRVYECLAGLIMLIVAASIYLRGSDYLRGGIAGFSAGLSLFCVATALYKFAAAVRTRVVLTREAIEVSRALGSRRLCRADIVGFRRESPRGRRRSSYLVLVPRDESQGTLALPRDLDVDAPVDLWLRGIPELDG